MPVLTTNDAIHNFTRDGSLEALQLIASTNNGVKDGGVHLESAIENILALSERPNSALHLTKLQGSLRAIRELSLQEEPAHPRKDTFAKAAKLLKSLVENLPSIQDMRQAEWNSRTHNK